MGRRPSGMVAVEKFAHLVGQVPDRVIAAKAGVSTPTVRNYRLKHGIDPGGVRGRRWVPEEDRQTKRKAPEPVSSQQVDLPGFDALKSLLALEDEDLDLELRIAPPIGLEAIERVPDAEEPAPAQVSRVARELRDQLDAGDEDLDDTVRLPKPKSGPLSPLLAIAASDVRVFEVSGLDDGPWYVTGRSLVDAAVEVELAGYDAEDLRITDHGPLLTE